MNAARRCGFVILAICEGMSWTAAAEEPHKSLPTSGNIGGEWSFKAGAELDADGRPAALEKSSSTSKWSWGIAVSGSIRITWGESSRPAAVPVTNPEWESRLIELTNGERAKLKRPDYKIDPALMKLAREQSAHMARLKQISHELEGRTFSIRMKEAGYKALAAGENCAEGAESPEMVVADWMTSEGHKGNILSERYTLIGVGTATDSDGKRYFTQIFAKPFENRGLPVPPK